MRRAVEPTRTEPDDIAPPAPPRRAALHEFQTLGVLYASLNYLAPLIRLWAIGTFLFGSNSAYKQVLGLPMAAIFMGVSRAPLFKLSGILAAATTTAATEDEAAGSSRFHQVRLVWSQGLRCVLMAVLYVATLLVFDPLPFCGRSGFDTGDGEPAADAAADAASHPSFPMLVGVGSAAAVAWIVIWSAVHAYAPREQLAMGPSPAADGTHDLSSASEDELLKAMPFGLRSASLGLRAASVALEAVADVLLILLFLPSRLEGAAAPTAKRLGMPPPALLAAAVAYGSQHLRFRGEWLLCSAYGLALGGICHALDGELLPALVGATVFAVVRHVRRTGSDVRRFHAQ